WNDDELTMLLNPETFLFGNPVAQAACAGDCVLSSAGFGSNALFWCAGCQGSIDPFNGRVQAHVSHVQASSLLVQRMTAKLHREGLMWGTSGS
ncbi:TraU family protein, partial [Salmonella sp. s60093]|uniref:TraU family protein n=1 Tax=Salmonella sp. s60093 TaxID=3159721 RepID=UPI0039801BA9